MKLYYSNTSPYSRKVRLTIFETNLQSQIEMQLVNPFAANNPELFAANPLGKIPALILDDGQVLYDSPVICHYLNEISESADLLPGKQQSRYQVLCWEALADGLVDAAYNIVMERRRPEPEQSATCMAQWRTEIQRVLQYLEAHISQLDEPITLAHLSLASAIGYLNFRLSELLDDNHLPKTLAWFQSFNTHLAMQATQPFDAPA